MKKRFCDQCCQEIPSGEDYLKVCIQQHVEKRQILTHQGDLCISCWNNNLDKKSSSRIKTKDIGGKK